MKDIEFVSYDGAFPNLCSGKLVLRIDGEERTFAGHTLISGGKVWFDDNWGDHVEQGEWVLDVEAVGDNQYMLGPFYDRDKDVVFTSEEIKLITSLVNENVEYGCCGGVRMSDKVFHFEPTGSGITAIMHHDPNSMIGCGIILDHATQTVLFRNGDGSEALIPADLLPEDLTTARGDLDALRVVKHLVELIRKHEQEQKDLWQYIKRGKMLARAEELAEQCRATDQQCPYVDTNCPFVSVRECGQVTPEHWLEILRKESDEEQSKTQNG